MSVEWLWRKALRFPTEGTVRLVAVPAAALRERAPKPVTRPETLDYRTMLPEPGGLFDPKLFGAGTVIDAPLPDPDAPLKPRRTQLARIALAIPIVHPLVLAHAADEAAELLGTPIAPEPGRSELEHGRALAELEAAHDLVIAELAVLPPDLRPLARDDEDRWATTPLNRWYQRILYANARLEKHAESAYAELVTLVHRLFENDELPDPELDTDGKPLPSLRTLCGGTAKLAAAAAELPAMADGEMTGRHHVARTVLQAMGIAVAGRPIA